MLNTTKLIVNDSYWKLFVDGERRRQEFITPGIQELDSKTYTVAQLTRTLALIMKNYDSDDTSLYGIEIKTNGSSRSSRIPLVRHSKNNQSIWRVVKDIKLFEKGVIELKDLNYYLDKTRTNNALRLPLMVLLLASPEEEFIKNEYGKFITDKATESKIIVITLEFILNLVKGNKKINFNDLFSNESIVLTTKPIEL